MVCFNVCYYGVEGVLGRSIAPEAELLRREEPVRLEVHPHPEVDDSFKGFGKYFQQAYGAVVFWEMGVFSGLWNKDDVRNFKCFRKVAGSE